MLPVGLCEGVERFELLLVLLAYAGRGSGPGMYMPAREGSTVGAVIRSRLGVVADAELDVEDKSACEPAIIRSR